MPFRVAAILHGAGALTRTVLQGLGKGGGVFSEESTQLGHRPQLNSLTETELGLGAPSARGALRGSSSPVEEE